MLFTLFSLLSVASVFATDFGYKAMKCIERQDFRKAPQYLRQARAEDNYCAFSNLASMLSFNPEDPTLQDLIRSLIAKDETGYLQVLSEIPQLKNKVEEIHVKATQEAMKEQAASNPAEVLMIFFAEGNHTMFKAIAEESYLIPSERSVQDLIKFLAEVGAGRYLETLAQTLINRENYELQVFIADAHQEMVERIREENGKMKMPVMPVVEVKHDPHPDDCIVFDTLAPKVNIWLAGSPERINNARRDGSDNVQMIGNPNANICRFVILDAGLDDVAIHHADDVEFIQWCTDVEGRNGHKINGMLAELDLNQMLLKLKRVGWKEHTHSIVLVRENKDIGAVELPECAAKFYFGEETATEIKIQELDLIYFVPSCLFHLPGMRRGIGSFMGILSLAFEPSDADQRMFSFSELRKTFSKYVGELRLYGIFFQK